MIRYIAIRVGQGALVVLGALAISFLLVNVAGNPVEALGQFTLDREQRRELLHLYGYDRPLLQQFVEYMGSALHGDFGESFHQRVAALTVVGRALAPTIYLVIGALIVTVVVAVPTAVLSVLRRGAWLDRGLRGTFMVLQGVPQFWLGVMLVLVFSIQLRWLPSFGDDGLESYVMPILALSIPFLSSLVRLLRSELLDIMGMEFVTALRAKGLSERDIVIRHALRNAMPSFVTLMALQTSYLFGGTIVVEAVFGWPGLGSLLIGAAQKQDLTVIQALVVVIAAVCVAMSLIADLLVLAIDPRLRKQA
jgi:ABC-type dipeptide/oligopeptide/nickel transport system permease component